MFVIFEISADDNRVLALLAKTIEGSSDITEKSVEQFERNMGQPRLLGMGKEDEIVLQVTYKCKNQEEVDRIRENISKEAKKPVAISVSYRSENR